MAKNPRSWDVVVMYKRQSPLDYLQVLLSTQTDHFERLSTLQPANQISTSVRAVYFPSHPVQTLQLKSVCAESVC